MTLQRRLLVLMLLSLGVAALTGVLAMLGGSSEILGRLALCGLWFAIGLAVSIAASRWLKRESTQKAAALSLFMIGVTVLIAFLATWIDVLGGGSRMTGRLAGSAALTGLAGQAAAIILALTRVGAVRISMRAALVLLAAGAVPMLCMIWDLIPGWQYEGRFIGAAFMLWGAMIPTACCLVGFPARPIAWRWIGVLAIGAGLPVALHEMWNESEVLLWFILECVIVAFVVSLAVVAQFPALPGAWNRLRLGAVASALAAAGCFTWLNLVTQFWARNGNRSGDEFIEARLGGVFAILAVAGTASLYLIERLHRKPTGVATKDLRGISGISVVCPRCDRAQHAPVGSSRCMGCGVVLTLGVSEPRCPQCEYALLDMVGDKCPECGIDLPEKGKAMVLPSKN